MLNENKATLDKLSNKDKVLPITSKLLILLFITGLSYFICFSTKAPTDEVSRINEIGKFRAKASARGGRTFCSIELSNKQIITLACPSDFYRVGQEVKLVKVTNKTITYYEVQDEVEGVFKTQVHQSNRAPNGAP